MVVSMSFDNNKKSGFVVMYRSFLDWEWYTDNNTKVLFIHCLLKANHKDKKHKGVLIKRGSFVTSREILSKETGLSQQCIRTALKHLESTNELTINSSSKGTIITINNYETYQQITYKSTSHQPTANQQLTTNNNVNNVNNVVVVVKPTDDDNFMEFYNACGRKGFINDAYEYWLKMDVDDELKKDIVYGAKEYAKENQNNIQRMCSPRTFLINQIWKNYKREKTVPGMDVIEDEMFRGL